MNYDNGEVLPGLEENWTFMGATPMELAAGLVVFLLISLFVERVPRAMPFMLAGFVLTSTTLATLRKSFPDQERGVRNAFSVACGVAPRGIPAPATIQPEWSGAPLKSVPKNSRFTELGLDKAFPSFQRQFEEC